MGRRIICIQKDIAGSKIGCIHFQDTADFTIGCILKLEIHPRTEPNELHKGFILSTAGIKQLRGSSENDPMDKNSLVVQHLVNSLFEKVVMKAQGLLAFVVKLWHFGSRERSPFGSEFYILRQFQEKIDKVRLEPGALYNMFGTPHL